MPRIRIDIPTQTLTLFSDGGALLRHYPVSTAAKGPGEQTGSNCTPRGKHIVRAKIGTGAALGTVFVGRRPTGEIWSPQIDEGQFGRDYILTRIIWVSGCEPGFNRLGEVDTMRRYIYIHGTHDEAHIGQPVSHGCIRMRNHDVMELFNLVRAGTPVEICA